MSFYTTTFYNPITCKFETKICYEPDDLSPEKLLKWHCKVKRHFNCCVLCAANEDCARLPVHVRCRCKPVFYVEAFDAEVEA